MNSDSSTIIAVGIFIAVLTITSGMLADRINSVEAELDSRTEFVYAVPHLATDIKEIKTDIKEIKEIILGDYSK